MPGPALRKPNRAQIERCDDAFGVMTVAFAQSGDLPLEVEYAAYKIANVVDASCLLARGNSKVLVVFIVGKVRKPKDAR